MFIQLTHEITDLKQVIVELRKENEYLKVVTESMNPVISNEKRQDAIKTFRLSNGRRKKTNFTV